MLDKSLISIIVVNWNGESHLRNSLLKLNLQTARQFEVVLVDNGSKKLNIADLVHEILKYELHLESLPSNLGFAAANNIGARLARGEWIVLLNADAYPEPDWLENLLKTAEENPEYNFFSSRQIQYNSPHLLDGAGDEYHFSGLAWRRFFGQAQADHEPAREEVFGACAAAAMYRREDFLAVGGFDEDYFSYMEDVDLSFRLRLAGGRCLYVPEAVVYHVGSVSMGRTSDFTYYHVHRNLVWTYFKDMPGALFWLFLPLHIGANLFLALRIWIQEGRPIALKAKWDAILALPRILRKRQLVQHARKASAGELYRVMNKSLPGLRRKGHSRSS